MLDTASGRLTGLDGQEVELRAQSREVLLKLAESPFATIPKQEFFETVWQDMHVTEDSLFQCIADIRQALGDTSKSIVETVPRKGYRLVPTTVEVPPSRSVRRISAIGVALAIFAVGAVTWWSAATDGSGPTVIAVLPFQDDSSQENVGVLGDAITSSVLDHLARYPELLVIARNSSFRFRDPGTDIKDVAKQLGAHYVLEGSQRLSNDLVAISIHLIDANEGTSVWSDQIEAPLQDILNVSSLIGQQVAHAAESRIADIIVRKSAPGEADSLLLNLKARTKMLSGVSRENLDAALALNRENIERFPESPWGYLGVAFSLRTQIRFGWADDADRALEDAIMHAERAVELGPENYAAFFALGRVRMQQGDQFRAIEAFERALQLNPSSADALNALAQSHFYIGQNERALDVLERSRRIDPLPGHVHPWMTAWVLWQERRCQPALESFRKIPSPPPVAHKLLAAIEVCLGNDAAARSSLSTFLNSESVWSLEKEKRLHNATWVADGALDRWLNDLSRAGMRDK